MTEPLATYGRLAARPTSEGDLDFVLKTERDPENARFVSQWSREEHAAVMHDPACAHLILTAAPAGRAIGYAILRGLGSPDRSIEFTRLTISEKGKGYGREALRLVKRHAFERLGAHRLWLDVMEHNPRARHLYASEGFVHEGTLRDALFRGGGFLSLHVMSMLEGEYRKQQAERGA